MLFLVGRNASLCLYCNNILHCNIRTGESKDMMTLNDISKPRYVFPVVTLYYGDFVHSLSWSTGVGLDFFYIFCIIKSSLTFKPSARIIYTKIIIKIDLKSVHSKSLDIYFRNRNNFHMVQYFYLFFSTGRESELFSIFSYKLYKNIVFKVAKNGTKIFNFQSFDSYKGKIIKIIPQCTLEL